jgi:6-phosphogluconolactonase
MVVDRRTFTALLVGGIAAPKASFAQNSKAKNVFYAAVGPELTVYGVDVDNAALVKRSTVTTPANIQYAWPHPSKGVFLCGVEQWRPGRGGRQACGERIQDRSRER